MGEWLAREANSAGKAQGTGLCAHLRAVGTREIPIALDLAMLAQNAGENANGLSRCEIRVVLAGRGLRIRG